jgi:hypothetical protein
MRKIIIGGLLLGVTGCAPPSVAPITSVPVAKSIIVVPSVPKEFRVGATGLTVFQNNLDIVDDSGWGLNQLAYDTALKVLTPTFQVSEALPNSEIGDADDAGDDVRQDVHVAQSPDLYVVIGPSYFAYPDPQYPVILRDVGVSEDVSSFVKLAPVVHTYLLLSLVDGKTLKTLYSTPLMMDPSRQMPTCVMCVLGGGAFYPTGPLENFFWTDQWDNMTKSQQEQIQDETKSLLSASIAYTLTKMNLQNH